MSTATQPIFDMSKAKPIFDMSKATAIGGTPSATPSEFGEGTETHNKAEEYAAKALKAAGLPTSVGNIPDWFHHLTGTAKDSEPWWEPIRNAIKNPTQENVVGAVPFIGPMSVAMAKDAKKGDYGGAAATLAGGVGAAAMGKQVPEGAAALKEQIADLPGIPSASKAASALGEVKAAAGEIPIDMEKPGNTALQIYEQSQRGATLPKVVRDFIKRAVTPESDPITYAEAKDFQSNVSALSADERMKLKPNTKRLLGQLNVDLKGSLEDAADTVGKGEQFTQAMKEYHHAMIIKNLTDTAKEAAWKAAVAGIVGYTGYKLFKVATD